ncbi:peptidylprolyl isomerase [Flavobacterium sp.]|jgi:peptidyl-prolyl cis-trans isomerase D|uniref:peptidylprolyl isomerase n=1 Tax=Flavobacterium sp. TaxID=239 RepID=UPI0037C1299A
MAVLQKIRQRSLLLIVVIGLSLLAFIIGDIVQNNSFSTSSNDVGSVNGKDITFEDFRLKVSNLEKSGQGMTSTQAANRVWDQEISVALLSEEFEKLGLRVGEKHILEIFKNDQNIGGNPTFQGKDGKFDIAKFKEFFKSNPEQAAMLKDQEKSATLNAKYQIYNTLLKAGMFTTEAEGKLRYKMESDKVAFDFVAVPYTSIKDETVKVTDAEILEFIKKNEKKYKGEAGRELDYVLIEDKASPEDEAEVKNEINKLLVGGVVYNKETGANDTIVGFAQASNTVEFVNANSEKPYDSTFVAKKDLPAQYAEQLYTLSIGQVFGPYMNGKDYCITKAMGRKSGTSAKASHILISYEGTQVPNKKEKRTKEQAKAKAEILLAQVQANPSSFLMLALTNSDDSSAQQGGDLGYFSPGQMVKPFNDFVFNNSVGKIGLVETDFGFHIINVTDKQDGVRLATISQKIEPSEATADKIYTQAVKFEMDANEKDFAAVAKAEKLTINPSVKVKTMDENFGPMQNQRQIVRWAFEKETKIGDVKRFEIANVGNVIAKVKKASEEGLMSAEDARPMVENTIRNKKKAEKIKAKMAGSSLATIASKNAVTVQNAVDLVLQNPSIPNAGYEPKVVGTAFGTSANKVSAPIEGNTGVYVIQTKAVTKAPVLKSYADYTKKVAQQAAGNAGRVIQALKSDAEIEDNRADFNY